MTEPSGFEHSYFIQTRQEIDAEQRARDRLLYIAVILLGAAAFAVFLSADAQCFLRRGGALTIEIPALAVIPTIFWIRRNKLQQICDRWFVLQRMAVRCFGPERAHETLESIVAKALPTWRYVSEDFTLNIALSVPIYAGLILQSARGAAAGQWWRTFLSIIAIAAHALYSYPVLGRRLHEPLPAPPEQATTGNGPPEQ